MADSTTILDLISSGQSQKEVTANALSDAESPAVMYGRRASTTSGLTWGYYGGRFDSSSIANGTVALTGSATNYVVAHLSTGAVSVSTSSTNWNDSATYMRLYLIVTGSSTVTSYEDHRQAIGGGGGGGGIPGGSSTQIQYNDSSAFAGSAKLTWDETNRVLYVNDGVGTTLSSIKAKTQTTSNTAGQRLDVVAGEGLGTGAGGEAKLTGGNGGASGTVGGPVTITGGISSTYGGNVTIKSGDGSGTSPSGNVVIQTGTTSANTGGTISIRGGATSGAGVGGAVNIGVDPSGWGGKINIEAGQATSAGIGGGDVTIRTGTPGSGGDEGKIIVTKGDQTTRRMTFFGQTGRLNIGATTSDPGVMLCVESDVVRVTTAKTPASAAATGTTGDICWDSGFIYICVATNTWKRAAIATW